MDTEHPSLVIYYPEGHAAHAEAGHPERPERVETLRRALEDAGAWQRAKLIDAVDVARETLERVHNPTYLEILKEACQAGRRLDADTYTTPASWNLAMKSAGGAAAVAGEVWQLRVGAGFALTRPPGHHATSQRGMGFCLLNNAAVAAQSLIDEGGAARLAVIDLDLHHGNGTQEIFWERGDVLYISTHQSPLYPGSGRLDETGAGAGAGLTVNIPLPPGSGDEAFEQFMHGLILPVMDRYGPEMLLVSFGFDPHWRDPLGHLQLSAGGYARLVAALRDWAVRNCGGRIAMFLEGGYDLEAAAACGPAVTAALLGERWIDPIGPSPRPEGSSWQAVYRRARDLWKIS